LNLRIAPLRFSEKLSRALPAIAELPRRPERRLGLVEAIDHPAIPGGHPAQDLGGGKDDPNIPWFSFFAGLRRRYYGLCARSEPCTARASFTGESPREPDRSGNALFT
jgi:hypothetical protein